MMTGVDASANTLSGNGLSSGCASGNTLGGVSLERILSLNGSVDALGSGILLNGCFSALCSGIRLGGAGLGSADSLGSTLGDAG